MHALPLICYIIDFMLNRLPIVMRHILIGIIVNVVYSLINMIITLSTGMLVYPIFTWTDGLTYLYLFLSFLILVFSYTMMYFLAKIKNKHYGRLQGKRDKEKYVYDQSKLLDLK